MSQDEIRTVGVARFTKAGTDVTAFHLHRYLAHWLAKADLDRVWVTLGYEHSTLPSVSVEVGRRNSQDADVPWTFDDLAETYHRGGHRLHVDHPDRAGEASTLEAVPLIDDSTDGIRTLLGFVVLDDEPSVDARLIAELEVHATEAIRAARRNGVRLFFDEIDERDMKSVLYATLERLPEWSGCDVAAAVVLSNSLDAMALEEATRDDFYVMAERLFVDEESEDVTRFVGMSIDTGDDVRTTIDAAIEYLQAEPTAQVLRFQRKGAHYVDEDGRPAVSIGHAEGRPEDAMSLAVPLVVEDDTETELMGFLCLAFTGTRGVPKSVDETLLQLAERLAHLLRFSPLYTLSASKLRLVRALRRACEAHVAREDARREDLVAAAVDLVKTYTDVPAFSVGFVREADGRRLLNYTTSYGWTDFDSIELLVDVAEDETADSGVSALAVRLNRTIILAGGRGSRDHQEFKNFLWVHEASGEIVDARAPSADDVEKSAGWTRLGEYYKPAREGAYATVAHPVSFDGRPVGVVALEVDRDTNWYWWAGHGGQLLWDLVASELAFALWAMRDR